MPAFNWLKRLRKSERGNVLIVGAATLPLLIGSAGLAVDSVQVALWKRQLQRAADSGAIAGAYALAQGAEQGTAVENDLDEHIDQDLDLNERPVLTDIRVETGSYGAGELDTASCETRGITPCFGRSVEVRLTAERILPFMSIFTGAATTFHAEAVAALVGDGDFCMISLYNGEEPGIVAGGNSDLKLNCGASANSRNRNDAFHAYGSATVEASPVATVGGISGSSKFVGTTTFQPYSAPVQDPLAHVPNPTAPSNCSAGTLSVANGAQVTLSPSSVTCYTSWDIKGTLTLQPGTYYVNNGLLDLKGKIQGQGVTIVLLGNDSDLKQNGGGQLAITAPDGGTYKGIAMFRDRTAANKTIKINGGADLNVTGAFYLPSSDVWIGGNADINATCLQIVGRILTFKGGGTITNACSRNGGSKAFEKTVVRLVG